MSMHQVFLYPITIKEHHLDSYGHVNNATYLQILEEARWEFITENGYGYEKVHQLKKGPVILDVHLRFLKELNLRQTVTIESQVQGEKARIMSIKQWIKDDTGKVYSEAEFKVAFFDMKERKMIQPTQEWLDAVGYVEN